jgi:hypothetical protein
MTSHAVFRCNMCDRSEQVELVDGYPDEWSDVEIRFPTASFAQAQHADICAGCYPRLVSFLNPT